MIDQNSTQDLDHLVATGTTIINNQKEVGVIDEAIVKNLSFYDELPENNTLITKLSEWMNIQKHLIVLNKKVTPKLESIMSLVANEYNMIKTGRSAMKGYSVSEFANGKNINNKL